MSHPLLVTLDGRSAPRTLFHGDRLVEVDLPAGHARRLPAPAARGAEGRRRRHPLRAQSPAQLRAPPRQAPAGDEGRHRHRRHLAPAAADAPPDVRERVLTVVLEMLADHGVDDVDIIIATSVHRRMTADEVRHIVGDRIFNAYWPDRLYNHDAEDPTGMKYVGTTDLGEEVRAQSQGRRGRPRHLREPEPRARWTAATSPSPSGCAATGSLRAHHNPQVMRECRSYMDPRTRRSRRSVERMGRLTNKTLNVFHIETTVNNRMFDRRSSSSHKNEDDSTGAERALPRRSSSRSRSSRRPRGRRSSSACPRPSA